MTAPFSRFTIYPTTEAFDYRTERNNKAYTAFCKWMTENSLNSIYDPESDEDCAGYFVYDLDGNQVAAVTLTDR